MQMNQQNVAVGETGVPLVQKKRSLKELDLATKWSIIAKCLGNYDHDKGKVRAGKIPEISAAFEVADETVRKLFVFYMKQTHEGVLVPDLTSKRLGASTKKIKSEIAVQVRELYQESFGKLTVRGMSDMYRERYGKPLPKSTMHEYMHRLGLINSK